MTSSTVRALGRQRYRLEDETGSRLAFAVVDGARTWVFLDGAVHVVEERSTGDAGRGRTQPVDDRGELTSPMPATVTAVRVNVGDRVARGDVVVTLEAMKMVLPITAPRDGVVRQVFCRAGDLVQPGVPLVALE